MNFKNTPRLETERLILRRFVEEDLNALFAIYKDEKVNQYLPWFPLKTMEEASCFWQKQYVSAYRLDRAYKYAICLKDNNIPIGYIHVSMDDSHDLGYGLCEEFWHKGIVTEAARTVIERVKADGIPYITATHDKNNPRSGGVMIQSGMSYQYSYEEQWQPKDIFVIFRMYQLNLDHKKDRVYKKYWDNSAVRFIEKEA